MAKADDKKEVFYAWKGGYNTTAERAALVADFGLPLATKAQLTDAQIRSAEWCATGELADEKLFYYPINSGLSKIPGCGAGRVGLLEYTPVKEGTTDRIGGVTLYGMKPNPDYKESWPLNTKSVTWNSKVVPGKTGEVSKKHEATIEFNNGNKYLILPFYPNDADGVGSYHDPKVSGRSGSAILGWIFLGVAILMFLIVVIMVIKKHSENSSRSGGMYPTASAIY